MGGIHFCLMRRFKSSRYGAKSQSVVDSEMPPMDARAEPGSSKGSDSSANDGSWRGLISLVHFDFLIASPRPSSSGGMGGSSDLPPPSFPSTLPGLSGTGNFPSLCGLLAPVSRGSRSLAADETVERNWLGLLSSGGVG